MRSFFCGFSLIFLALSSFAEEVKLAYIAFDTERFEISQYIEDDLNLNVESVSSLLQKTKTKIEPNLGPEIDYALNLPYRDSFGANLLLIGYGKKSNLASFFAATTLMDSSDPLVNFIASMKDVKRVDGGKWYFYFVSTAASNYVINAKDNPEHFWGSPFKFLDQVGRKSLQYYPVAH
jgi:hypothetical protein